MNGLKVNLDDFKVAEIRLVIRQNKTAHQTCSAYAPQEMNLSTFSNAVPYQLRIFSCNL